MRLSLVVATAGRTDELSALLASLVAQSFQDFEVIVIDQNDDDRLRTVIAGFTGILRLRREACGVRNSSVARNQGLIGSIGDIVAFPDDDCEYPPDVIARVVQAFDARPDLTILTGPSASPTGELGSGRWHPDAGPITWGTLWTSVIEFNLFARREWMTRAGGFDERIGVGALYGSGEGADLVAKALETGLVAFYNPQLRVVHPDKRLTDVAVGRAFGYAVGMGFVLVKHPFGWWTRTVFLVRPAVAVAISLIMGRWKPCRYYFDTLRGRLYGMWAAYWL